jgi:membrane fusion protein (multidrug efflux system)
VTSGEVLFTIERAPFEAEVQRNQATVAQADAELANARIQLARAQQLLRTSAGTQARVDDATAAERSGQAQLMQAQAALVAAQINLSYTQIIAPVEGYIGRANITVGNVVSPDSGVLATIVSQDPMYVEFDVSTRLGSEMRARYADRGGLAGVRIRVRFPNGDLHPEEGTLNFIDPQVNRSTDTYLLRASIPNPVRPGWEPGTPGARSLIDGQLVTVIAEGREPIEVLSIPRAAILQDQQGTYVFVVDAESKVQVRRVRLGQSTADVANIEQGLEPGENVVLEGIQRVRPGQQVQAGPIQSPVRRN